MAKSRFIQNNFVSGELSPLLKGRTDINQYYQGCETAENVVIVPQGGLRRRPGMAFVTQVSGELSRRSTLTVTAPNGGTASNLTDGDDTTLCTSTVPMGTTSPYVFATAEMGGSGALKFIDIRGLSLLNYTGDPDSGSFVYESSPDGVTYNQGYILDEVGSEPKDYRIEVREVGADNRFHRIRKGGVVDFGSATMQVSSWEWVDESSTPRDYEEVHVTDFEVSADENFLVSITPDNIQIINTQNNTVANLDPRPWDVYDGDTDPDMTAIRTAQVENVMLIVGNFAPKRLVYLDVTGNFLPSSDWFLDQVPFTNVPQFDFDDDDSPTPINEIQVMDIQHGGGTWKKGERFEFDIEGVTSKSITFAGDATADEQAATVFNIQKNLQDMPVFGETGVLVERTAAFTYRITISGESTKDFELFSAYVTEGSTSHEIEFTKTQSGSPRKEDVWSSTRGWPKTICFYEGRLVLGGTQKKPQSLFMSKAGDFFNFDTEDTDDDDGIFATISSRKLNDIVDVYPGRNLQVFTTGAEFAVTSRPVTPANVQITPQTAHGASNVQVEDVDGSTIFIDRFGKSLLTFLYSFNEDAYTSDDRSVLASHLINQPQSMALLKGTASDDANWLAIANLNGDVTVLNTLRSQDINGFTSWKTSNGNIRQVSSVADNMYFLVSRTDPDDSQTITSTTIERWDFDRFLDGSVSTYGYDASTGRMYDDDLAHFVGQTVTVKALWDTRGREAGDNYGYVYPEREVFNDATFGPYIILEESERLGQDIRYEIGFPFTPRIKTMPLNTNIGSGENSMRLKKIVRLNVRVYETYGVEINGQPVPIRSFGSSGDDSPLNPNGLQPVTGIIEDWYDDTGWGREVNPEITAPGSGPFHIQMIEYEVEGN